MEWIDVNERLPEPEERVIVCAESNYNGIKHRHITFGMYEDGNILTDKSDWNWDEGYESFEFDEENDDLLIPKGWWEYALYNSDDCNYLIDDIVTHWMPMPELPLSEKGGK